MNPRPMAKSSSGVQPVCGSGASLTGVGVGVAGKGGTAGVALAAASTASVVAVVVATGVWLPPAGATGVKVGA